jgi:hypothetical protein
MLPFVVGSTEVVECRAAARFSAIHPVSSTVLADPQADNLHSPHFVRPHINLRFHSIDEY